VGEGARTATAVYDIQRCAGVTDCVSLCCELLSLYVMSVLTVGYCTVRLISLTTARLSVCLSVCHSVDVQYIHVYIMCIRLSVIWSSSSYVQYSTVTSLLSLSLVPLAS